MRVFIYLFVFALLFVFYVRYLEDRTLFVPAREILADPSHVGLDFEDITITTEDGLDLNAWFIKASGTDATLIFCHGNAGNIGDRLDKIKTFHDIGFNVMIFDYRGYGNSEGHPSEEGIYKDVQAVYDYLMKRSDVDEEKIIAYGASLGGAPAIDLAAKREVAALIIDSSFSNAADMAKRIFPFVPSFLIRTKLDSINKIKKVAAPALFFHSIHDATVPYALGRKLYEAANEPKRFVDLAGSHNDVHMLSADVIEAALKDFLKAHNIL